MQICYKETFYKNINYADSSCTLKLDSLLIEYDKNKKLIKAIPAKYIVDLIKRNDYE